MTSMALADRVADVERTCIVQALEATNGNRKAAAKLLGISLRTLFYKMRKHGERDELANQGVSQPRGLAESGPADRRDVATNKTIAEATH